MTVEEEDKWDEEKEGKEYPDGHAELLNRRDRARTLMSQKATSVADVAFVVDLLQKEGHLRSAASVEELMKQRRAERLEAASKRRTKKLRSEWKKEEKREQWYRDMTRKVQEGTKWGLDMYSARRISLEHGGLIVDPKLGRTRVLLPGREGDAQAKEGESIDEREEAQKADTTAVATSPTTESTPQVRILWSDLRDATFAASWPETVSHAELERLAVSRRPGRTGADAPAVFVERSVHVMGGMKTGSDETWMRGRQSRTLWAKEEEEVLEGQGKGDGDGAEGAEAAEGRDGQQTAGLEGEGVVIPTRPRQKGVIGWVRGRLGMAA